jgi:hypothetical protein
MPPKVVPVVWGPNGVIPGRVRQDADPREAVVHRLAAVPPLIPPPPPAPPAGGPVAAPAIIPGFPEVLLVRMSDICTYNADAIVIATDVDMQRRNEPYYTKFHTLAGPNLRLWNDTVHYQPTAIGIGPPAHISELQTVGSAVRSPGKSRENDILRSLH